MPSTRLQFSKNLNHKSYTIFFVLTWFVRPFLAAAAAASYRRLTFYSITVVCFHFSSPHTLLHLTEHFALVFSSTEIVCSSQNKINQTTEPPASQHVMKNERAKKIAMKIVKLTFLRSKTDYCSWCFDRFIIRPLFYTRMRNAHTMLVIIVVV